MKGEMTVQHAAQHSLDGKPWFPPHYDNPVGSTGSSFLAAFDTQGLNIPRTLSPRILGLIYKTALLFPRIQPNPRRGAYVPSSDKGLEEQGQYRLAGGEQGFTVHAGTSGGDQQPARGIDGPVPACGGIDRV
jgi:hypothetical protein